VVGGIERRNLRGRTTLIVVRKKVEVGEGGRRGRDKRLLKIE
jgi:hypothetical protein